MSLMTLATVKEFLRVNHTREDTVLQIRLDALEDWVSRYTSVRFNAAAGDEVVDEYLDGGTTNLWPTWHPITTLNSVTDRESSTVVTASLIRSNSWRVWFRDESLWSEGIQRWQVNYDAGYLAADLPAGIQGAILDGMYRAYRRRGGGSGAAMGVNLSWDKLMAENSDLLEQLSKFRFNSAFG